MFSFIKGIVAIAFVALVVNLFINLKFPKQDANSEPEVEVAQTTDQNKILNKKNTSKNRAPASTGKTIASGSPVIPESTVSRSSLDKSNFEKVPSNNSYGTGAGSSNYRSPATSPVANKNDDPNPIGVSNSPSVSTPAESVKKGQETSTKSDRTVAGTVKTDNGTKSSPKVVSSNSVSISSTGPSVPYTCSPNLVGGSFNNPISVRLSCTYTSTIKYCLGVDTGSGCCNPESSGINYSSEIIVGATNATYCLSYYGTSSAGVTPVYAQTYTINSTLPDLQVSTPVTHFQTTELSSPGKSFVTSNDFGKPGFGIGQINLKAHDPGPMAENLTCEEIVNNYVALPAPAPLTIISLLDVSSDNPATQIQIPFRADQLDYGENFITSYIENSNNVSPIYSCFTSKVTLSDFEFFISDVTYGDPGTNAVREFAGGFSSYGFFEPEATVFRDPAGESEETLSGEKLESGLFRIFY